MAITVWRVIAHPSINVILLRRGLGNIALFTIYGLLRLALVALFRSNSRRHHLKTIIKLSDLLRWLGSKRGTVGVAQLTIIRILSPIGNKRHVSLILSTSKAQDLLLVAIIMSDNTRSVHDILNERVVIKVVTWELLLFSSRIGPTSHSLRVEN